MEQSVQSQHMLAAIDLGSNSFHMVIARLINGQIQIIDQRGEKVQLAAGLSDETGISEDAEQRALDCLKRFAEPIRGLHRYQVTALATNTLRVAKNRREFIQKANDVLGFPIEVISGVEEARLVYLGVAHTLADDDGKRLVIDIGGGSTEFVIGERFVPKVLQSLSMGCVSYTDRYFSDGELTEANFNRAVSAARRELQRIKGRYLFIGWENTVGSSGTNRAVSRVLQNYGLSDLGIDSVGLSRLKKMIIEAGHIHKLVLQGLKDQRLQVLPAGVAILIAIFKELKIDTMSYSDGALREGAIHDLIGRGKHEDVREKTVKNMQSRFVVDTAHAMNVKNTAMNLYKQVSEKWNLDEPEFEDWLRWSADLHEIGLSIAHHQSNKHGAYLIQNCDMPGFSKQIQEILSLMVRHQRKKAVISETIDLSKSVRRSVSRLIIILRLAILFHQGRDAEVVVEPKVKASKFSLELDFPEEYLSTHAMTVMNLESEKVSLNTACYELKFK
jgi:exopolyphosphatase/guanosine-5'-triphosphate,3'-diphosphate pyrophosphatase